MASVIYIHGFLSSPLSFKAQQVEAWLQVHRPELDSYCPFLPAYPAQAQKILETLVESLTSPVYLMGSSMGGYWCSWLAEKYHLRAVLINPAVQPSMLMPSYLGVELKNYHTDDTYILNEKHIDEIRAVDTPKIKHTDNYWLMVQTADETLDYRLAVEKYQGCKTLVEEGGDHGFQNFDQHIPAVIAFLEQPKPQEHLTSN